MVNASLITDFDECKYFELIRLLDNQQIISFSFQEGHYFFEVKLDGQRKFYEKNENPQPFENVKVWTNDLHGAEPAGGVRIRNLHIESGGFSYPPGKFSIKYFHEVLKKQNVYRDRVTSYMVDDNN